MDEEDESERACPQARTNASPSPICEKVVYRHGAMLLILRVRVVLVLGGSDHMEDDQDRGDEEIREGVEALEREEEVNGWRDNEHVYMRHALRHLEPFGACEQR